MSETLQFHRRLYTATAVHAAIEAYAELARIRLERADAYFVVSFDAIEDEVRDVLLGEFANYALAETIEARR